MSLLFLDGFGHSTSLSPKWDSYGGGAVGATGGRFGGNAYASTNVAHAALKNLTFGSTTGIHGFAYTANPPSGLFGAIACFMDAGSVQVSLSIISTGELVVMRSYAAGGANILGRSNLNVLASGQSYYIEWKVKVDPSAGTIEVRVNGTVWITATGLNTRATANTTINAIRIGQIGGATSFNEWFADMYVFDSTGTENNDFAGDCKVPTLFPSGAGSSTQMTPSAGSNFQCVDETSPNGDTDYVSDSVVGHKDLYAMGNLPSTSGTIKGIQVLSYDRKDDAGTRQIKNKIKSGATEADGATVTLGTSYVYVRDIFEHDPDTGAPWTPSGVNAIEAGTEIVA